jgi:hypothetical protein
MKSPYPWLSPPQDLDKAGQEAVAAIDKKEWSGAKKNLYMQYYLAQLARTDLKVKDLPALDQMKSWRRTSAFKKCLEDYVKSAQDKFRLASMSSIIAETLLIFFLRAIFFSQYVINFSMDAIAGAVFAVVLASQMIIKYRLLKTFANASTYAWMDILSLALCLLLKMWLPMEFDFSLIILLINYYLQKKKFFEALTAFEKEN